MSDIEQPLPLPTNRTIEYGNTDHMPAEVASSMLRAPKAKLSNRERKNCKAALEVVMVSSSPIVRNPARIRGKVVYQYQDGSPAKKPKRVKVEYQYQSGPKSIDEKLTGKLLRAKHDQLTKWLKRAHSRRMQVQRAYLRVVGTGPFSEKKRAALELKAAQLDIFHGAVYDELRRRSEIEPLRCTIPHKHRKER